MTNKSMHALNLSVRKPVLVGSSKLLIHFTHLSWKDIFVVAYWLYTLICEAITCVLHFYMYHFSKRDVYPWRYSFNIFDRTTTIAYSFLVFKPKVNYVLLQCKLKTTFYSFLSLFPQSQCGICRDLAYFFIEIFLYTQPAKMLDQRTFAVSFLFFFSLALTQVSSEVFFKKGSPHVKLNNNAVISGSIDYSREGRPFSSFMGIPYATIPSRFEESQLVTYPTWDVGTVKSFTEPGHVCSQLYFDGSMLGKEDCLNLNIFVPMNNTGDKRGYPVMVWVHGGDLIWFPNFIDNESKPTNVFFNTLVEIWNRVHVLYMIVP